MPDNVARGRRTRCELRPAMQTPSEPIIDSRVQHDLLLALFEATPDFVFFKNLDGCYVAMNNSGARAIGLAAEDIIGKDDYELFSREVAERWRWEDREVLAAGTSLTFEDQMQSGNRTIHLQTIKSPWRNQAGETIGTVGVGRILANTSASTVPSKKLNPGSRNCSPPT